MCLQEMCSPGPRLSGERRKRGRRLACLSLVVRRERERESSSSRAHESGSSKSGWAAVGVPVTGCSRLKGRAKRMIWETRDAQNTHAQAHERTHTRPPSLSLSLAAACTDVVGKHGGRRREGTKEEEWKKAQRESRGARIPLSLSLS